MLSICCCSIGESCLSFWIVDESSSLSISSGTIRLIGRRNLLLLGVSTRTSLMICEGESSSPTILAVFHTFRGCTASHSRTMSPIFGVFFVPRFSSIRILCCSRKPVRYCSLQIRQNFSVRSIDVFSAASAWRCVANCCASSAV